LWFHGNTFIIDYIIDNSNVCRVTVHRELTVEFPWKHFNLSISLTMTYVARIFWWWHYWKYAQYMDGTHVASKNLYLRDHSTEFPFHPSCQYVWWHTCWWANYKFCFELLICLYCCYSLDAYISSNTFFFFY
jgi:hypothetical protein